MSSSREAMPLTYRRLGRAELDLVCGLDLATEQMERFLGPLPEIVQTVRSGPAHHMIGIEEAGALVGFYVVHADPRDGTCWWLGWFAIGRPHQGGRRGVRAMAAIMIRLRQIPGCREVRLLVAADNEPALRLYARAGFTAHGIAADTGELIMRCVLAAGLPSSEVPARFWANAILLAVIDALACRLGVPVAAQLHGEVAHPP